MKLIRTHNPKSRAQLVELVKSHAQNRCDCGVRSQGTIEDFGQKLYNAQITFWGEHRFTLQQCKQWEYDLLVVQSLKGATVEKRAVSVLQSNLPDLNFEETSGYLDEELRIDVLVSLNQRTICGIQVKPESFLKMRKGVLCMQHYASSQFNTPVINLFYNSQLEFIDLNSVLEHIYSFK